MARSGGDISQTQRLAHIRKVLNERGEVVIRELAGEFGVSEMTVRRDLAALEERGELMRIHGGAASAQRVTFEFRFRDQHRRRRAEKRAIAARALAHIEDGQVIILDTGTTTLELARQLGGRRVSVITTSLAVVSELQFAENTEVILLGGHLREGSPDLHGPLTEQNLEQFRADIAFVGADAIDAEGAIYTDDLRVLQLDRKMAAVSRRVIALADSSKFARNGMCRTFRAAEYDLLITDGGIDPKLRRQLERRGRRLEIVNL